MEKGQSIRTNMISRFLSDEVKENIEMFLLETSNQKYLELKSIDEVNKIFSNQISEFLSNLTEDELLDLRSYTGYNFKFINAVLRDNWTYEEHGLLNDEKRNRFLKLSERIKLIIDKFPKSDYNFMTYRGTSLSSFSKYGIKDIEELVHLKDKYIYEEGFTSTSVLEDSSYYQKQPDTGKDYNVEIRYIISSDYTEGALLLNNNLTYSLGQNEYLINKGSLSKVMDVTINEDNNTATLTAIVVPQKIWDYQPEKSNDNSKMTK